MQHKVVIAVTHPDFPDYTHEKRILQSVASEIDICYCYTPEEVIRACRDAQAILTNHSPITREVIAELKQCKVIVRYGIGYENVDCAAAAEHHIAVINVPDYGVQEVADHTLALLLAVVRKITTVDRNVRQGEWRIEPIQPIIGLAGKTLGLAGFGNIARAVARRAQAFDLRVIAYDPFVAEEMFNQLDVQRVDFTELAARSDILCCHLPLNDATKHLFRRETFEQMKRTAYLINTSRGGVIHTGDLVRALETNVIAGAGLDVYEQEPLPTDHPLLALPNCTLTAHTAWYSEDSMVRLQQYAALEVKRVLSGEPPKHTVNSSLFPKK